MTFRMERRRAQVSGKVNILHDLFDVAFINISGIDDGQVNALILIIVELMIGEPNGDSYDYSSSINEASSCLVILISIASCLTSMRLLNW